MIKKRKTKEMKALDLKRLKIEKRRAEKKALKIVLKLQKEIEWLEYDFSRIGIGQMSKLINFPSAHLKYVKKEFKKPYIGGDSDDDTSLAIDYLNL